MRSLLLASACTILTATSAAANQFSVRCEGGSPPRPYFATFDTERKITVLESSSIDPNTSLGSNPFAGELTQFKEQIELVLHTSRGTVNLIFDPRRNTMFWPSFNDTFRPELSHSCTVGPPRSILSLRSPDPIGQPSSVQCEKDGNIFFTMDPISKKALAETESGSTFEGKVTSAQGNVVELLMDWRGWLGQISWNISNQELTIESLDNNRQKSSTALPCKDVPPRTMLQYYEKLRRK